MVTKHKSPQKRNKQDAKRNLRNVSYKSKISTAIKEVEASVIAGDKGKIQAEVKKTQSIIDKAATKGILKKNTVARRVSKIMRNATRHLAGGTTTDKAAT